MERTIEEAPHCRPNPGCSLSWHCAAPAAVMEGIDIQSTGLVAPQYAREFGF